MTAPNRDWISRLHLGDPAGDVLRDVNVRGRYSNAVLPITVLRRARRSAWGHQAVVLDIAATLDAAGIAN